MAQDLFSPESQGAVTTVGELSTLRVFYIGSNV
jgi:hypothetical protein